RPVRLVVVSRPVGQLRRVSRSQGLPPERSRHRVNQFLRIRPPSQAARPARQLRQIQFAVIIRMWLIDLRQHRPPLRARRYGDSRQKQTDKPHYSFQLNLRSPAYYAKTSRGAAPLRTSHPVSLSWQEMSRLLSRFLISDY